MRKSYRLIFVLVLLVAAAAGAIQSHLERNRAMAELRQRLLSVGLGLREAVAVNLITGRTDKLARTLREFGEHEPAAGAVVCSEGHTIAIDSRARPWFAMCNDGTVLTAEATGISQSSDRQLNGADYLMLVQRIEADGVLGKPFSLLLVRSMAEVDDSARAAFFRAMLTALGGALVAIVLIQLFSRWLLRRSLRYLVNWTRNIFHGQGLGPLGTIMRSPDHRLPPEFRELTRELGSVALRMRHERLRLAWGTDERQALLGTDRVHGNDPEQVAGFEKAAGAGINAGDTVQNVLKNRRLVVVANREPYVHERKDGHIRVVRPASGVVSALEPIMRMCGGGIWVAHGSGSADHDVVDANDEVRVPPENPTYTIRRVWLTREEEDGYYYGFANEGLWPLCHLAYTRPTFRLSDWEMYKSVNQKFSETTLRRLDAANAVILVQDYHYALLPRLLRESAPLASIELFWHIPWPNPEAFGICPQYKELLEGMLGADVVGFHTQFHCNNFLETCDRYLECRVDWERFSVTVGNRETLVRSYPISIATEPVRRLTPLRRAELKSRYGITTEFVALGVDRLDYTKGLVERMAGIERFLEKYPQYIGKFSFVEMGTPSRTNIPSYRALITEVEQAIERVNNRFGFEGYRPIVLLKGHFDWNEVADFYQLGLVCLVTSLHDGMNLVAKEYVWSQDSEQGALILSRFTGAARELAEALIVNPYSSEEIADALFEALNQSPDERRDRMRRMKEQVQGHNAFHWATDLLAGVSSRA
ncbi:MAG: trehalose-6-phosphate synthase [Deltaproteobacteria bacterium]|nr:trehalose-6-phosphate synthase [Deltaproteobacteria bacterium]